MLNRSNLHNYQNNIVQHIKTNNGAGVFAQMGLGKEQPYSEKVLTVTGWKTMGELKVGDKVIANDGTSTPILNVFEQGEKDVYLVTFMDGSTVRCGLEHLWLINANNGKKDIVVNTKYLIDKHKTQLSKITARNPKGVTHKLSVNLCKPVVFNLKKELKINPYVLGVLLGDGGLTTGTVKVSLNHKFNLKYFENLLPENDKLVIDDVQENYTTYRITCPKVKQQVSDIKKHLNEYNLMGKLSIQKHIPKEYLTASIKDRLQLLQGLLDTDGHQPFKGIWEYSTSSQQLALDAEELIRSLGIYVRVTSRIPTFTYKGVKKNGERSYRLYLNYNKSKKTIINVEKLEYKEKSKCIEVSHPSHTYITTNYTVTHNTASTLTALNDLINGFEVSKVLIVAPLTVAKSVWHNEAVEWEHLSHLSFSIVVGTLKERETALKKKADIYIINKENIPWLGEHYQSKFPFDMIVIDESSAFKNASSKRFKMLRKMINLDSVKRTVILTGTPAPNGYIDLWSQIFILDKGQRLGKNISMYRRSFFDSDFMGYKYEIKSGAKEDIDNRIKDIVISLQAKDYLEMPDFIPSVINIAMSPKLSKLYYDFEQDMIYNLQELKADDTKVLAQSAATLTGKLLQFSSGAMYNDLGEVENVHDLKFEALDEIIENNPNEQILVFYNFKFEKEKLAKRYKDLHFMDKDMKNVDLWNDKKIKLLALHPASAGHGLNLQKSGASLIVWLGFQWSLELYQQANGRLYRQGQKNHVRCVHLAVGDIEYRLLRALAKKENVQQALMDALKGE